MIVNDTLNAWLLENYRVPIYIFGFIVGIVCLFAVFSMMHMNKEAVRKLSKKVAINLLLVIVIEAVYLCMCGFITDAEHLPSARDWRLVAIQLLIPLVFLPSAIKKVKEKPAREKE